MKFDLANIRRERDYEATHPSNPLTIRLLYRVTYPLLIRWMRREVGKALAEDLSRTEAPRRVEADDRPTADGEAPSLLARVRRQIEVQTQRALVTDSPQVQRRLDDLRIVEAHLDYPVAEQSASQARREEGA